LSYPDAIQALVAGQKATLSLLVRSGSKAYGIDLPDSDDDYVGVFIPRLRDVLSIHGIEKDTIAATDPDTTLHEIGKFCRLALKGNPAALETLWNPDVLHSDEWGRALIEMRGRFLHRGSLDVYAAYAESQLKKMLKGKSLHSKAGAYNGKFGAHLIRLLHAGIGLAATGKVMVRVPPELAQTLLKIRSSKLSMGHVLDMARPLLRDLQRLSQANALPEKPAAEAVNELVIQARLSQAKS
jgi:predicted nucleotidyltransferase